MANTEMVDCPDCLRVYRVSITSCVRVSCELCKRTHNGSNSRYTFMKGQVDPVLASIYRLGGFWAAVNYIDANRD
jgi:hypothetical protein